jgi:hypothetical protein
MNSTTLELLLIFLLAGALVCVAGMLLLKAKVPSGSEAHSALFQQGTLPPYSSIVSLRMKFFLPWVSSPVTPDFGLAASWALVGVRAGAYASLLSLLGLIALGLLHP